MTFLLDTREILEALLADRGLDDPTYRRLVGTYQDVATLLDCRDDYDRMVAGLQAGFLAMARQAGGSPPRGGPPASAR